MLRYRASFRLYVGDAVSVTVAAFDAALLTLMQAGCQGDDAYTLLLLEDEWDIARPGVTVLAAEQAVRAAEEVLHEHVLRRRLLSRASGGTARV